jgi:CpeT protein
LRELTGIMAGSFSSAAQAQADPEYFDIRLQMQPIWPELKTPTQQWLYVEQARGDALDKPYRQRVYKVRVGETTPRITLVSEVYELPGDPLQFAGWWKSPEKFASITPEQLKSREGCEVVLTRIAPGVFEGSTVGSSCVSALRGATYATSQVHADATGLHTWDRGYDQAGSQVWGAVKGGYHFLRVFEKP